MQVVKILLQYGSNISDRNVGGQSALDLAMEENIKELLQASLRPEHPCGALPPYRQAGDWSFLSHDPPKKGLLAAQYMHLTVGLGH